MALVSKAMLESSINVINFESLNGSKKNLLIAIFQFLNHTIKKNPPFTVLANGIFGGTEIPFVSKHFLVSSLTAHFPPSLSRYFFPSSFFGGEVISAILYERAADTY